MPSSKKRKAVPKTKAPKRSGNNSDGQLRHLVKNVARGYLELNEKVADRMFELGDRLASATGETPIKPALERYQKLSRKAFNYYVKRARSMIASL